MAHFAKIGFNNVVLNVVGVDNSVLTDANDNEDEGLGAQALERQTGWDASYWKKTSYNTRGGKYYNADGTEGDQSKAYRKNYAMIGGTYDETRDAFIPKKPYASWILNETTCQWESPTPKPTITTYDDGGVTKLRTMQWSEANNRWEGGLELATTATLYWDGSAWQDI